MKATRAASQSLLVIKRVHESRVLGELTKLGLQASVPSLNTQGSRYSLVSHDSMQDSWSNLNRALNTVVEFLENYKHELHTKYPPRHGPPS